MNLYYVLVIFLILIASLWIVWKWIPDPPKTVLLWVLGIAMVAWVLSILGFWRWLQSVSV